MARVSALLERRHEQVAALECAPSPALDALEQAWPAHRLARVAFAEQMLDKGVRLLVLVLVLVGRLRCGKVAQIGHHSLQVGLDQSIRTDTAQTVFQMKFNKFKN